MQVSEAEYTDTNHVLSAFADAASVYAQYKNVSEAEVLSQLQRKISSTVTDRAPVNHCVVQLQDIFNVPILELNCNVHPLDALATPAHKYCRHSTRNQILRVQFFESVAVLPMSLGPFQNCAKLRYLSKLCKETKRYVRLTIFGNTFFC